MFGEHVPLVHTVVGFVCCLSLAACADDFVASEPPSQPSVVQNIGYTTNIYNPPATLTMTTTETPDTVTVETRPAPRVITPPPVIEEPRIGVTALPPPVTVRPRDTRSTGVPACDAYLARIETCSTRMMSRLPNGGGDALDRIVRSLDMSRRAWRNASVEMSPRMRASLSETCTDSLSLYDESASSSCN
jgi:hypothetical protein